MPGWAWIVAGGGASQTVVGGKVLDVLDVEDGGRPVGGLVVERLVGGDHGALGGVVVAAGVGHQDHVVGGDGCGHHDVGVFHPVQRRAVVVARRVDVQEADVDVGDRAREAA